MDGVLTRLGCQKSRLDPALFCYREKGELKGIVALWVDDFIQCGDSIFYSKVVREVRKTFVLGKIEKRDFTYVG